MWDWPHHSRGSPLINLAAMPNPDHRNQHQVRPIWYPCSIMMHLDLQPQLEAELAAKAQAQGVAVEDLVEHIIAERLAEEALRRGLEDIAAGRTRLASEVFAEFREQHGIRD